MGHAKPYKCTVDELYFIHFPFLTFRLPLNDKDIFFALGIWQIEIILKHHLERVRRLGPSGMLLQDDTGAGKILTDAPALPGSGHILRGRCPSHHHRGSCGVTSPRRCPSSFSGEMFKNGPWLCNEADYE